MNVGRALADAQPRVFWLDRPERPDPLPPLSADISADLLVVGGGYSGLWAALQAKQDDPGRDVVLLEAGTCGWAASGRNGGFCAASLTHGLANGAARFPAEIATLETLGQANLEALLATIALFDIRCDVERTGEIELATAPHHVADLASGAALARSHGHDVLVLGRDEVRAEVDSPTYLGGVWHRDRTVMLDPARLAWGLRDACLSLGVRIFEHTRVTGLARAGAGVLAWSPVGSVRAGGVVLAANAFPPLLRRLRAYVVPVYDYALVTRPLSEGELASIGWRHRQGLADSGNQFHYYRLTADNRILFGGYDAVYHFGNRMAPSLSREAPTYATLARHFFETFPQLSDVTFTHRWGGVVDTCARFCAFFGTAFGGRLAYATGFTGLGVGASRFGARVALDLLSGADTPLTTLDFVRSRPIPFPPEPLRALVINATRWSMAHADSHQGRRNLWLRTLDRFGLGFDS
ncbi:glycine/D-amino acid oxidase-like deaminating enzyme [Asanoa ferruginea]|uniref:Glycine/D-amino acid oxidase-like deaminating enzyme n=1 Tax=Asanoa ferruginea TaxID=53367 RepID=A0A3D9ZCE2_9ACTN|nr:FAD-dependent oxidoreductase [Asanoa ferruginea]REF95076.1 glycine/D-amino acid oxidase-like deaminating enzyme [Asanoa ferruginea]GIF48892.1 oxidoreductase [Asanoa ferruginea]